MTMHRVFGTVTLLAVLLIGASLAKASQLTVIDPYARATPPGIENSAAYLALRNSSDSDRRLVAAESPVARAVELHTHLHEDGMMRMRQVEHIDIPAQGEVKLQPGGLHIMLLGLERALAPGERIPLTLRFADGEQLSVEAEVRHPIGQQHHGHGHSAGHKH